MIEDRRTPRERASAQASLARLGRRAEMIVGADTDDVVAHGAVGEYAQWRALYAEVSGARDVAEVHVEIFGLGTPTGSKHRLDAATDRIAGKVLVGCRIADRASKIDMQGFPLMSKGCAAGGIEQRVAEDPAPAPQRPEIIELMLISLVVGFPTWFWTMHTADAQTVSFCAVPCRSASKPTSRRGRPASCNRAGDRQDRPWV